MSLILRLILPVFLLAACTTAQVEATRQTPARIEPKEAIAILFSRNFSVDGRPVEEKEIVSCISDEVRKAQPSLKIVLPDEFRRAAFPDLAPEGAPSSLEYLGLLFNHASFRGRISSLGIRYLIAVRGGTEQKGEAFGGGVGGFNAGIAVVGQSWDRKTALVASIMDLKQGTASGEIKASASGSPWVVVIFAPFPFPIGVPALTEAKACGELGQALAKFLAGERPSELEKDEK